MSLALMRVRLAGSFIVLLGLFMVVAPVNADTLSSVVSEINSIENMASTCNLELRGENGLVRRVEGPLEGSVASMSVQFSDFAGYGVMECDFEKHHNLEQEHLGIYVNVLTGDISHPISLTLVDRTGRAAGVTDVLGRHNVKIGDWSWIKLDPYNLQWRDDGFDPRFITGFRFSSYNDGKLYVQEIGYTGLILVNPKSIYGLDDLESLCEFNPRSNEALFRGIQGPLEGSIPALSAWYPDFSSYGILECSFNELHNLESEHLGFYLRVLNDDVSQPASITLNDNRGRAAGITDVMKRHSLETGRWGWLRIRPDNLQWADDEFDPRFVKDIRLSTYDDGNNYSQELGYTGIVSITASPMPKDNSIKSVCPMKPRIESENIWLGSMMGPLNDSIPSLSVKFTNLSDYGVIECEFEDLHNLENHGLGFYLNVLNDNISQPISATLVDSAGRAAGITDVLGRHNLKANEWGWVRIDPYNLQWRDDLFDPKLIKEVRFSSYDQGKSYIQEVGYTGLLPLQSSVFSPFKGLESICDFKDGANGALIRGMAGPSDGIVPSLSYWFANFPDYGVVSCSFNGQHNLEENHLGFYLHVLNDIISQPISVTILDSSGRSAGITDILDRHDFKVNEWGWIRVDPYNLQWRDDRFDPRVVKELRFSTFNAGKVYTQEIGVTGIKAIRVSTDFQPASLKSLCELRERTGSNLSRGIEGPLEGSIPALSVWFSNFTGYGVIECEFEDLHNLENQSIGLYLHLLNDAISQPISATLVDSAGRAAGITDVLGRHNLKANEWGWVRIDPYNLQWRDDLFDPKLIKEVRFSSYDQGKSYIQEVGYTGLIPVASVSPAGSSELRMPYYRAAIYMIGLILVIFSAGLLFIGLFRRSKLLSSDVMMLALPVGISAIVVFVEIVSLVVVNRFLSIFIFASVPVATTWIWLRGRSKEEIHVGARSVISTTNVIFVILSVFSILRLADLVSYLGWSPVVDAQTHGGIISAILDQKRIPWTTQPIGDYILGPARYPLGFASLAASVGNVLNLVPGQAMLILAATVAAALPVLVFVIALRGSGSIVVAIAAFFVVHYLPGSEPKLWMQSHDLILSPFLVGTFPYLLGNALFLSFMGLLMFRNVLETRTFLIIIGLSGAAILFGYFPFVPIALASFILMTLISNRKNMLLRVKLGLAAVIAGFLVLLFAVRDELVKFLNLDVEVWHEIYSRYAMFAADSPYFPYTILMVVASVLSIGLLRFSKSLPLAIVTLILTALCLIPELHYVYVRFLWFTQPDRLIILGTVASVLLVMSEAYRNLGRVKVSGSIIKLFTRFPRIIRVQSFQSISGFSMIVLALLITGVSLYNIYRYDYPQRAMLPNLSDHEAMLWLSRHVSSDETVLNDGSSVGQWLSSYGPIDVVNAREILLRAYGSSSESKSGFHAQRAIKGNEALNALPTAKLLKAFVEEYGVKYIYLSDAAPPTYFSARGGNYNPKYHWYSMKIEDRGYHLMEIKSILSSADWLETVYSNNGAIVLSVRQSG
ncbi:hypothetical protein FIL93_00025 [SAR202 cluster bacterium AD-493-K16_JPT_193m]|nr:hypothetical protein [SAR202 cluster bacterium AD-493-K16_JPT_193m]